MLDESDWPLVMTRCVLVDMDRRVLTVFLSLWSSVVPSDIRLVGGVSHCDGRVQRNDTGHWEDVDDQNWEWDLQQAAAVCWHLNCGSVVSLERNQVSSVAVRDIMDFLNFMETESSSSSLMIRCSDSVRLVDGPRLCSGTLEMKLSQPDSSQQLWSTVCEDNLDLQDAVVLCRELDCGAPSFLNGEPYGQANPPLWTRKFLCKGHESALLNCPSSVSDLCISRRNFKLTCADPAPLRLVTGVSKCSGVLEVKVFDEWKQMDEKNWSLMLADAVCGQLDCGSAVSIKGRRMESQRITWAIKQDCDTASLLQCFTKHVRSSSIIEIQCSDSVRLVNGTKLCSGILKLKSNQLHQSWFSVCEDGLDFQDANVVCRELGCGAPSVIKSGLNEEVKASLLMKAFYCNGHESTLQDCRYSQLAENTCPSGKALELTCSEPDDVRLLGGHTRCSGEIELRHHEEWRPVNNLEFDWDLTVASVICRWLDCGSAVFTRKKQNLSERPVWQINSTCLRSQSSLKECVTARDMTSPYVLQITCSVSARLVNGKSLCSGRLEVRPTLSDQSWSMVCKEDFDQKDAEVVCRELDCGAPLVLQSVLYGEVDALMLTGEFQCKGNEPSLLDCAQSDSVRKTCPVVELTCSDPSRIRLVGKASRCAGTLEMTNQGEWRPVADLDNKWGLTSADAVCRLLDCGSAVSGEETDDSPDRPVWWVRSSCVQSPYSLLTCVAATEDIETFLGVEVICTDLLVQPIISFTPSDDGVSQAEQQGLQVAMDSNFTITCSTEPQYQGGSFQLMLPTSATSRSYTLPAVNHTAHFLFSAADHTHCGDYSCIYHLYVFSNNFTSESRTLHLTVSVSVSELIVRLLVLLLGLTSLIAALCCHSQACRVQKRRREEKNSEINDK